MPGRRIVQATVAVLVVMVAAGLGGGGAAASGIDPCYRWCFILGNRAGVTGKQCNTRCRATDRYKCDSKCILKNGNSPRDEKSCRKKCIGLPGPEGMDPATKTW
jgi:hypothetical protein